MRMSKLVIVIGFMILVLACNFPTRQPTAAPICTAVACKNEEIMICPDKCPNGCGYICVTPTGPASNNGSPPNPTPTDTPYPMCTPPACKPGEQYYCEGECLGGCGTTCATPTSTVTPETSETEQGPKPTSTTKPEVISPPVIISFTADKTSITQGDNLEVSWVASGGTSANIQWLGNNGTMEGVANILPDGSTLTINPVGLPVLNVTNNAGTTSKHLELTVNCALAWLENMQNAVGGGCPKAVEAGWAAQQPFENGFMIWLQPSKTIIVFFNDYGGRSYRTYNDTFMDGELETDPNINPPGGLVQPKRGFGKVWRENDEVRQHLGWATADETGFETWRQSYQGMGMHNITVWVKDIDLRILQLDPNASAWKIYTP